MKTSKYIGVYYDGGKNNARRKRWRVCFRDINGNRIHKGRFKEELIAARVYNSIVKMYKPRPRLNKFIVEKHYL